MWWIAAVLVAGPSGDLRDPFPAGPPGRRDSFPSATGRPAVVEVASADDLRDPFAPRAATPDLPPPACRQFTEAGVPIQRPRGIQRERDCDETPRPAPRPPLRNPFERLPAGAVHGALPLIAAVRIP